MNEIWIDIGIHKEIDYTGLYMISNLGRVKSFQNGKERFMAINLDKNGYPIVWLSKNKVVRYHFIHKLIAKAFIPNPENKKTINHKNGIKTDNRIENLEWLSIGENTKHAWDNKLIDRDGEKNCNVVLTEPVVKEILKDKKEGMRKCHSYLKYKHLISRGGFDGVWYRTTWKHIRSDER